MEVLVVVDMVAGAGPHLLLNKILHHLYRNGLNQVPDINMQDLDINIWAAEVAALKHIPTVL
jgi:hypothetical protein